ncbi:hypothetical protein WICPIJ_008045 [Wickerhamomyces pijperi]|uniref:Uncharacterized protein n=1 Tax=Wickerhamomyces pijperi TaxID=599730 RepID=A0A9P8TJH2_WICPI|nr:hypothetical protein WICPIJ_008045 [Wickerhamomyces pijperi]
MVEQSAEIGTSLSIFASQDIITKSEQTQGKQQEPKGSKGNSSLSRVTAWDRNIGVITVAVLVKLLVVTRVTRVSCSDGNESGQVPNDKQHLADQNRPREDKFRPHKAHNGVNNQVQQGECGNKHRVSHPWFTFVELAQRARSNTNQSDSV